MTEIEEAARIIRAGGIVAYPTESVYGIGCDPRNQAAVEKLCQIKRRDMRKGFILIAACFEQLASFCAPVPAARRKRIEASWPGPHTWLFPLSTKCPPWLHGEHSTIAVRVSAHPVVAKFCKACESALISTSANLSGQPPLHTAQSVRKIFRKQLDFILDGKTGQCPPTPIRDAISDELIRT